MADSHRVLHRKKKAFLKAFAECGQISGAAVAVGMDRCRHYQWLKEDPAYVELFNEAEREAAVMLEDEATRRARDGVKSLVLYQGEPVMVKASDGSLVPLYEFKYSDTLLIFRLKGLMPERYRDRAALEHSGPGGKPLLTLADIDRIILEGNKPAE